MNGTQGSALLYILLLTVIPVTLALLIALPFIAEVSKPGRQARDERESEPPRVRSHPAGYRRRTGRTVLRDSPRVVTGWHIRRITFTSGMKLILVADIVGNRG
jgi:hypothetical protein